MLRRMMKQFMVRWCGGDVYDEMMCTSGEITGAFFKKKKKKLQTEEEDT